MRSIFIIIIISLLLTACASPQVTATRFTEVTVTLPPTAIPTPTLHPQFTTLQDQIAAAGENFILLPDGTIEEMTADGGRLTVPGLSVDKNGEINLLVNGEVVVLNSADMSFDDKDGAKINGYEFDEKTGEWLPTPDLTPAQLAIVAEGSKLAEMGIPVGSELNKETGIYTYHSETGDVEVAKVVDGKVEAQEFLKYKIHATAEEALLNPWPIRLDANGKPVGPLKEGKAGDLCQLTAEPLPENVLTGQDVDGFEHLNRTEGSMYGSLRWSKEALQYFYDHPEDAPVKRCGFAAGISPFPEVEKRHVAPIWQWKNPDGSYVYLTNLYNMSVYGDGEDEGRPGTLAAVKDIVFPRYLIPNSMLDSFTGNMLLLDSVMRDQVVNDLILEWRERDIIPAGLQDHATVGSWVEGKKR